MKHFGVALVGIGNSAVARSGWTFPDADIERRTHFGMRHLLPDAEDRILAQNARGALGTARLSV